MRGYLRANKSIATQTPFAAAPLQSLHRLLQPASPKLKLKSHRRANSQCFIVLQHHGIRERWKGKAEDKHQNKAANTAALGKKKG